MPPILLLITLPVGRFLCINDLKFHWEVPYLARKAVSKFIQLQNCEFNHQYHVHT